MTSSFSIGQVTVYPILDAAGDYPRTLQQVYPDVSLETWERYRERYPEVFSGPTTWHMFYHAYLLRSMGRWVLVDTGVGPAPQISHFANLSGRLIEALHETGVAPENVDTVLFTHMHADHIGGAVSPAGEPYFPNARHLIHQLEWDLLSQLAERPDRPLNPSYVILSKLRERGLLELCPTDVTVTDEVAMEHTPGHTPGHMSVSITSGGARAMVLGDAIHHPAEVTEPEWESTFDMDRQQAIATRKRLLDQAEAGDMGLLNGHFMPPGYGKIARADGKRYWQGISL